MERREPLVQIVEVRRNCGKQLLAERQVRAGQPAIRRALRRDVGECAARTHQPAVAAEDRRVGPRDLYDRVRVRVLTVRRNRIRLTAGARRSRIRRRIPSHVGERRPRIGRADERAAVCRKAIATVGVGTTEIDHIGLARRRVDYVVIPALTRAVIARSASWSCR